MAGIRRLSFREGFAKPLAGAALLFSLAMPLRAYGRASNDFSGSKTPNALRDMITPMLDRAPEGELVAKPDRGQPRCTVNDGSVEYSTPKGLKTVPLMLAKGEKVLATACIQDRAFVLTDRRLYATTSMDEESGVMKVLAGTIWFDISEAYEKGIVAWAHSYDTCYILTKDGKLAPIFVDETEKNQGRTVYTMPFPVDGAKMAEFKGWVFLAVDDENVMAFRFNEKADHKSLLINAYRGAEFTIKNGRLFYGGKEGITEIKVEKGRIVYQLGGPKVDR